ncbi:MAG: hypothetical protein RR235_09420, partial [Oscillospiraceae bacterium]
ALTDMEVPLTGSDNTDELIAKIKDILVGDLSVSLFDAAIIPTYFTSPIVPTSYFEVGEILSLSGATAVKRCNKISDMRAVFDGFGADGIQPVGDCGWTKTADSNANQSVLKYICPERTTKFSALEALNRLRFTSNSVSRLTLTIKAYVLGATAIAGAGACEFTYSTNSWEILERIYPTWQRLEGKTWTQIEALRKANL